jgi:hypothetical protein
MIVLGATPAATFLATLACSAGASSSSDDDEEESSSSLKRRAAGGAAGCAVAMVPSARFFRANSNL